MSFTVAFANFSLPVTLPTKFMNPVPFVAVSFIILSISVTFAVLSKPKFCAVVIPLRRRPNSLSIILAPNVLFVLSFQAALSNWVPFSKLYWCLANSCNSAEDIPVPCKSSNLTLLKSFNLPVVLSSYKASTPR